MHELLLFGQIAASRHDQVLNILAGVAAMQPVAVFEKHLVFKPNRPSASARPVQVSPKPGGYILHAIGGKFI